MEEILDYLLKPFNIERKEATEFSPLVLAYIGDAVYELIIRSILVSMGNRPVNKLNRDATSLVKATASLLPVAEMNCPTAVSATLTKATRTTFSATVRSRPICQPAVPPNIAVKPFWVVQHPVRLVQQILLPISVRKPLPAALRDQKTATLTSIKLISTPPSAATASAVTVQSKPTATSTATTPPKWAVSSTTPHKTSTAASAPNVPATKPVHDTKGCIRSPFFMPNGNKARHQTFMKAVA